MLGPLLSCPERVPSNEPVGKPCPSKHMDGINKPTRNRKPRQQDAARPPRGPDR